MVGGFLFQEQHVLRHLGKMASYFFSRFGLEGFGVFGSYDDGSIFDSHGILAAGPPQLPLCNKSWVKRPLFMQR